MVCSVRMDVQMFSLGLEVLGKLRGGKGRVEEGRGGYGGYGM